MNDDLERMWKEATVAEFNIYRHLPGGTKETYETAQDSLSLGRGLNAGPFRIRSRSVNRSTTTLGKLNDRL
jgi:hypothetical protein